MKTFGAKPLWNDPSEEAFQFDRKWRKLMRAEQIKRIVTGKADTEDKMLRHERAEYARLLGLKKRKEAKAFYAAVTKRIREEEEQLQREIESLSSEEAERERQECEAATERLKAITDKKHKAAELKRQAREAKLKARPKASHKKKLAPVASETVIDADGVRKTVLAPVVEEPKRRVRVLEFSEVPFDDEELSRGTY